MCCVIFLLIIFFRCEKEAIPVAGSVSTSSRQDAKADTVGRQLVITVNTGNVTYPQSKALLWLPIHYKHHPKENSTYPLIINLYGQEQTGKNLNELLQGNTMSEYIAKGFNATAINPADKKKYAFFVFSPQCPTLWGWSANQVYTMLQQLKKKYPIDETRIYLTGFSAGGWGLWSCMTDNDDLTKQIAAIVPISSAAADNPGKLSNIAKFNVACLNVCGDQDAFYANAVKYTKIINLYNPKIPAELNTLHKVGHSAWVYAYDHTWKTMDSINIYKWMLQYKRKK